MLLCLSMALELEKNSPLYNIWKEKESIYLIRLLFKENVAKLFENIELRSNFS